MGSEPALPPFPNGWYVFAFSGELRKGGLLARRFMGQEVVVFRTRSGRASAADAYCPHLGAHFGYGGRVEGELLRCPFHGFRFDVEGTCVGTGYGTKPPPTARLRLWSLREVNGMLLVYYGSRESVPTWEIPALPMREWTPIVAESFTFSDHPQETTENSVDVGHFAFVHRYRKVNVLHEAVIEGPYINTAYEVTRPFPFLGGVLPLVGMRVRFETHIYGFGYSLVGVTVPRLHLHARFWVLPTATDAGTLILRLATSVRVPKRLATGSPLLRMTARAVTSLLARSLLRGFVHDAKADFPIWQHKRYRDPPALAKGDGPIGRYRVWARQFYE
jgi:nitrite reductase/ring-hydroxylating ferredoxin subunit